MKRGLFLPEELPSLSATTSRKRDCGVPPLDRTREAITPDPGTPFARVAALESAPHAQSASSRHRLGHEWRTRSKRACHSSDAFLLRQVAPAVFTGHRRDGKQMRSRTHPARPSHPRSCSARRPASRSRSTTRSGRAQGSAAFFGMRPWALFLWQNFLTAR
jgi:hypothetical protein